MLRPHKIRLVCSLKSFVYRKSILVSNNRYLHCLCKCLAGAWIGLLNGRMVAVDVSLTSESDGVVPPTLMSNAAARPSLLIIEHMKAN